MERIKLTLTFTDQDGRTRTQAREVETNVASDPEGERLLANNLLAEMKVDVHEHPEKHYATVRSWLDFPSRTISMDENFIKGYFDVQNSQAMWFELANLVRRIEADLAVSLDFKNQEPTTEPSLDDTAAVSDLHYIHSRKMEKLDHAVHSLIKVQDLANRLLHESLGGDLVDTSDSEWEKNELNRKKVQKGLKRKLQDRATTQEQFDAISKALAIPEKHSKKGIALSYRNRLSHHLRPSVDYVMFFPALESRKGEEIKEASGTVKGKTYKMRVRPPLDYRFHDLHAALVEYLDAVVEMLDRLNHINLLRKYEQRPRAAGAP